MRLSEQMKLSKHNSAQVLLSLHLHPNVCSNALYMSARFLQVTDLESNVNPEGRFTLDRHFTWQGRAIPVPSIDG